MVSTPCTSVFRVVHGCHIEGDPAVFLCCHTYSLLPLIADCVLIITKLIPIVSHVQIVAFVML